MTVVKTLHELNTIIEKTARRLGLPVARVRTTFIGVLAAQMLPDSVAIKGGLAIKMQRGELGTRATSDLDGVFLRDYKTTIAQIREHLKSGWGRIPPAKKQLRQNPDAPDRVAFTGTITEKSQHDPGVRRPEYLMRPVRVTLNFLDKPWGAIDLELAHPELNTTISAPKALSEDLTQAFDSFGFGRLAPVSFLSDEVQIAQKIHALTHPASDRAHDLVDLQLLWTNEVDPKALKRACQDTFRYRKEHPWPPLPLRSMSSDRTRYDEALQEVLIGDQQIALAPDLESAREWLESKIRALNNHTSPEAPSPE